MHLNIPHHEAEKLARHATAAGFASVENYVTEFVLTLAERPRVDEIFAPLTDDELAGSLAMIDRGMAEIDGGKGLSVEEARRRTRGHVGAANK